MFHVVEVRCEFSWATLWSNVLFALFSLWLLLFLNLYIQIQAVNMNKWLVKSIFFSFPFSTFLVSPLISSFSFTALRLCSLLQSQQTKWKHMEGHLLTDSQHSWLWGQSVSLTFTAHQERVQGRSSQWCCSFFKVISKLDCDYTLKRQF